ncbi:unnamed protein product [Prunus brigantina]
MRLPKQSPSQVAKASAWPADDIYAYGFAIAATKFPALFRITTPTRHGASRPR